VCVYNVLSGCPAILTALGCLLLIMSWKKKWRWVVFSSRSIAMASENSSMKAPLMLFSEAEKIRKEYRVMKVTKQAILQELSVRDQ